MKLRYDENAQDRNFEPGDKILALLPIPGKPLQARYYGPYTVDKKLSDVNYTVNTPGRRKQKQLCHINMLKKYIDRDSSVISSVNLVNNVPLEQNQMDSEDMNFVKSDPASSKLKNSDILKDLDQKLSHLSSDKRLDVIDALNTTSRYLDDILNINNVYFDNMVSQIYPSELHLNKANASDTEAAFLDLHLSISNDIVSTKVYD